MRRGILTQYGLDVKVGLQQALPTVIGNGRTDQLNERARSARGNEALMRRAGVGHGEGVVVGWGFMKDMGWGVDWRL